MAARAALRIRSSFASGRVTGQFCHSMMECSVARSSVLRDSSSLIRCAVANSSRRYVFMLLYSIRKRLRIFHYFFNYFGVWEIYVIGDGIVELEVSEEALSSDFDRTSLGVYRLSKALERNGMREG